MVLTSSLLFPNLITKKSISCSSINPDISFSEAIDYDYLEGKYKRCGVRFTSIGHAGCVLRMELENGSAAKLMLPSGLITSVKAQMWHGGTTELLHTSVEQNGNGVGVAVIRGGLSLALSCDIINDDDAAAGIAWSPHAWSLHKVTGIPQESIQVGYLFHLISFLLSLSRESHNICTQTNIYYRWS